MTRNKNLMLALESAQKALEPPPLRSRKARDKSRALVAEYADDANLSPATQARPAKLVAQALPQAGHDLQARPATQTRLIEPAADLLAGLPPVIGYLKLGNQIVDHLLPQLEPYEQLAYLQLYRLSHGNGKPFCLISMPKLAKRTKISERSLWRAISELDRKGLVRKTATTHGKSKEQGITYWVATPASPATSASPDREAGHDREADNKRNTLKDTHNTEDGVRVSSRFSLTECRRYAESLRADGITNPGGYATKIHRSGEADELIAKFLEPVESAKAVDVSGCPDCHGTGFYEPGGAGKGVARCKHERLLETK